MKTLIFILCAITAWVFDAQAQDVRKLQANLDNAVAMDGTRDFIFIVEQGKNRILKLDLQGILAETLGGLGSGDYQFDKPVDIEATNGLKIYISDRNNNRVQIYDRRFQFLTTVKARPAGRDFFPGQMVVNDFGELIFHDQRAEVLRIFDENGSELPYGLLSRDIKSVNDIKISGEQMFILDKQSGVIHELSINGRYNNFIPADKVNAFYPSDNGTRAMKRDTLFFVDEPALSVKLPLDEPVRDMFVVSNSNAPSRKSKVYLLTGSALYLVEL